MRLIAPIMVILSLLLGGCTGNGAGPQGPAPPQHGIARSDAEALVGRYLQEKVEGRFDAANQMLHPRIHNVAWARTPEWTQWEIVNASEVEEGWLVETREHRTHGPTLTSSVGRAYYLVVKGEGGKLFVDVPELRWSGEKGSRYATVATSATPDQENPNRRLVMTEGGTRVLAEIEPDLPKVFRPFGAGPDVQFGVGDNGWGALALSPDLTTVAFVTRGTHAFLGLVDRQGAVKGLDLWFEGGAGELAWSFDGRYLAATNASPRGIFTLQLWDLTAGQPVKVTGLPDGQDVSHPQWINSTLHLRAGVQRWMVDPVTGRAVPSK
ncbi:MAG: hypothetical protein ACOY94_22705 [Bacillota bacterium]